MPRFQCLPGLLFFIAAVARGGVNPPAPAYSAASVVNAASYSGAALAPNMIGSVFGTNLSFKTVALTANLMQDGGLPLSLGGVTVYVGGLQTGLYYVSPTQINFLIPNVLRPGTVDFWIAREGFSGPVIQIPLTATSPGIFQDASGDAVATHLDGSLVSGTQPAHGDEWIVVYATGLGRTVPDALNYTPAEGVAPLVDMADFSVSLNGQPVDPSRVYYAGLTPGYAGLYQVNVKVPQAPPSNPEIRVSAGGQASAAGTQLFTATN